MGERAAFVGEKKTDAPVRSVRKPVQGGGQAGGMGQGLMPMCGMHKVGGWGVQPAIEIDEEDAWPLSSQESVESCMTTASADSVVTPARVKRSFSFSEEDEDEDENSNHTMTVPLATPGTGIGMGMGGRQIAIARGRGRRGVLRREGSQCMVSRDAEMDFGEAEWLGPRSPSSEGGEEGMKF